jgi:hypothetical protein
MPARRLTNIIQILSQQAPYGLWHSGCAVLLKQLPPSLAQRILPIPNLEPAFAVAPVLQLGHDSFQILLAGQPKELLV